MNWNVFRVLFTESNSAYSTLITINSTSLHENKTHSVSSCFFFKKTSYIAKIFYLIFVYYTEGFVLADVKANIPKTTQTLRWRRQFVQLQNSRSNYVYRQTLPCELRSVAKLFSNGNYRSSCDTNGSILSTDGPASIKNALTKHTGYILPQKLSQTK